MISALNFSTVHFSTNNGLNNLKCCLVAGYIRVQGTVSQNLVVGHSLYVM